MGLGEYLKRKRSASVVDTRNRKQKTNRNEAKNKDSIPSKTKSASIDARPSKRDSNPNKIEKKRYDSKKLNAREEIEKSKKIDAPKDIQDPFRSHIQRRLTEIEADRCLAERPIYHRHTSLDVQTIWSNTDVESTFPEDTLLIDPSMSDCGVLKSLQRSWMAYCTERNISLQKGLFESRKQQFLYTVFSKYKNASFPMKIYPTKEEGYDRDTILDAAILHCVNHVQWSKIRLQDHIRNRNASKKQKGAKENVRSNETHPERRRILSDLPEDDRLLGFTFPKVLILVPFRNAAFNVVNRILKFAAPEQTGIEKVFEKLKTNYGPDDSLEVALKKQKKTERRKPPDHEALFYGHVADTVSIGIKFHLNGEISVFRPLAESDVFVASPISLAMLLEKKDQEITDLLSSIEIVVLEKAEVLLMQNWQHVVTVMEHLNQMPKEMPSDVNMLQVRSYFLKNQGRFFRQTLMFSTFVSVEMNALFNGPLCRSIVGSLRFRPVYPFSLQNIPQKRILHRFERYSCSSPSETADARWCYFKDAVLPKLHRSESGVLLFIQHTFDLFRVCDLLKNEGVTFGDLSEYATESKAKKLRKSFKEGEIHVLVTTERAYFYTRPRFKGVKEIIFYSLPEHGHFYMEIVQGLSESIGYVTVLVSRFSAMQLERILGRNRTVQFLGQRSNVMTQTV